MKLYYRSSAVDNEWNIQISKFELKTDEDLLVMQSTFHSYETKGLIEMNANVVRSIKDILKMLKHPQPSLDNEI